MSKKAWMSGVVAAAVAVFALTATSMGTEKAKAAPINDKCPLSGKDVDASKSSEVKVGFCCGECKGKFEKDPSSISKIEKLPNEKCPLSGKAVAKDCSTTVAVAFCCGNCKGKFDADPTKFVGKVKAKEAK
jgi:YHS domain-containing protein